MSTFLSPSFLTSLVPLVFKVVLMFWGRGRVPPARGKGAVGHMGACGDGASLSHKCLKLRIETKLPGIAQRAGWPENTSEATLVGQARDGWREAQLSGSGPTHLRRWRREPAWG